MYLYVIKNWKTGGMYVGQTSVDPRRRWSQHHWNLTRRSHTNPGLQEAWIMYGEDAFTFHVVATCANRQQLDATEKAAIDRLRLSGCEVYNVAAGGLVASVEEYARHGKSISKALLSSPNRESHYTNLSITNQSDKRRSENSVKMQVHLQKPEARLQRVASNVQRYGFIYTMIDPSGVVYLTCNLKGFCRDRELDAGYMKWILLGVRNRKFYKGWTVQTSNDLATVNRYRADLTKHFHVQVDMRSE